MKTFQILDSNDVVLQDNVAEEVVNTLIGEVGDAEFNYFIYPLNAEIKSAILTESGADKVKFIKEILETEE